MTSLQKFGYSSLAFSLGAAQSFAAGTTTTSAGFFGSDKAKPLDSTAATDGVGGILALVQQFLSLVAIIAVVYCIWAGFQIMTAGGDEEKVKSGRKTLIQVVIGIVVMWIAYSLVTFIIGALS